MVTVNRSLTVTARYARSPLTTFANQKAPDLTVVFLLRFAILCVSLYEVFFTQKTQPQTEGA
jgi:hypothetical protein